jgi:hypothetical protein
MLTANTPLNVILIVLVELFVVIGVDVKQTLPSASCGIVSSNGVIVLMVAQASAPMAPFSVYALPKIFEPDVIAN